MLSFGSALFMGELLTLLILESCCFSFWTEESRSSRGLVASRNGFEEVWDVFEGLDKSVWEVRLLLLRCFLSLLRVSWYFLRLNRLSNFFLMIAKC